MSVLVSAVEGALSQGDILKDIQLFETNPDGEPEVAKRPYCLVLSRDCAVTNKNILVVAAIKRFADVPNVESFDTLKQFFTVARDGDGQPDTFYLGQLPGVEARWQARFDELHTIQIPKTPDARMAWVAKHRVARLTEDFILSLPVRIFGAIGRRGFDDHEWYSKADVTLLVTAGERDLHNLRSEEKTKELQFKNFEISDTEKKANEGEKRKKENYEKEFKAAKERADALEEELATLKKRHSAD